MQTYQDNTHHKDDHADDSSERNKVVWERERKLRLEDHISPVGREMKQYVRYNR